MNNEKKNVKKVRNLSLGPLTPDPIEVLDLIAELKKYLKTVDYRNDSIYEAYFSFEYGDTRYRMDSYALSASPAVLYEARDVIIDRLYQLGATNVSYHDRCD